MENDQDDLDTQGDDLDPEPGDELDAGLPEFDMSDMQVEGRPGVDYASMSKAEFEKVAEAARLGRDPETKPEMPTATVEAMAKVAEVAADPEATPERIMDAVPKTPEPEVIGVIPKAALGTDADVPVLAKGDAEAQRWADFLADNARAMADRRATEQAGVAPADAAPVDYDSLSTEAILALADSARTGIRPTLVNRDLTPDDVRRAFGDE